MWKIIPGIPNYKVNARGQLRRYGRVLRERKTPSGYRYTDIRLDGQYYRLYSHRAVCLAWHGPPPPDLPQVNHLNGVKSDNRPANVEWSNSHLNNLHKSQVLGKNIGILNPATVLTDDDMREIDEQIQAGRRNVDIARDFDISPSRVSQIRHRRDTRARRMFGNKPTNQTNPYNKGVHCGLAKLTEAQVSEIRRRSTAGRTAISLAREYGVGSTTIGSIITRKTWTHLPEI